MTTAGPETTPVTAEAVTLPSSRKLRIWLPLAIIALATAVHTAARWGKEDLTGMVMIVLFIWPAALFTVFLWFWFAPVMSSRGKTDLLLGAGGLGLLFLGLVRFELNGAMIPSLQWRWAPTAESRAVSYFRESSTVAVPTATATETPVELTVELGDWPDFRGDGRAGEVRGATMTRDWAANPPAPKWKHPIGVGWSSFVGVGNYAWTMDQLDDQERVVCLNLETGEQVWTHVVKTRFSEAMGGDGPRSTPVYRDGKVHALGANGDLHCLMATTGEVVWSRNILKDASTSETPVSNLSWAMSGSPWIEGSDLIVNPGGTNNRAVICYDVATGEIRWAVGGHPAGYTSITQTTIGDTPTLLLYHGVGISGLDRATGQELWHFPYENTAKVNAVIPIVHRPGRVTISASYGMGTVQLQVEPRASGTWSVEPTWTNKRAHFKFNDPVLMDGHLYGLDEGVLLCLDVETGQQKWKKGRYGFGQVIRLDDVLLITSETGELSVVHVSPEKAEVWGRFPVIEGKTWNHPAVVRGNLLIRNAGEVACLPLPVAGEPQD